MDNLVQIITQNGFSAVLLAWMIYKDYKFNSSLEQTLASVRDALSSVNTALGKLEAYHVKEAVPHA